MGESPYPGDDLLPVPHDPDTEQVLLTSICLFPDHPEVPEILSLLNGGESFMVPRNKAIYLAFKSLVERQEEVSSVALKAECEVQGTLARVGGLSGILEVVTATEEVMNPLHLARRIQDLHQRRQLQRIASKLLNQAHDPALSIEELLDEVKAISGLAQPSGPLLTFPGLGALLDTPAPPPRWVIPGLIPYAVPFVVASKGGLGKSFLFLQACVALAAGKPFLDFPAQPPMTVLYLGLEDPRETFQARLQSIVSFWKEASEWSDQDDQNLRQNMEAPMIHWRALGTAGILASMAPYLERYLEDQVNKGRTPGLVVIDTLARVSEGDENTVQALRPILNVCFRLADLGFATGMLHHVGKGQDGAKGKAKERPLLVDRMSTDWVRGSSAIVDNFRAVIQMTQISQEEAGTGGVDIEKARRGGYCVMGPTKTNGVRADWRFLEQDDHGRWFCPPWAAATLAKLLGHKAVAELDKQTRVLADIYREVRWGATLDLENFAKIQYPDKEVAKAKNALHQVLNRLRRAGLLQEKGYMPTAQGLTRIQVSVTEEENG